MPASCKHCEGHRLCLLQHVCNEQLTCTCWKVVSHTEGYCIRALLLSLIALHEIGFPHPRIACNVVQHAGCNMYGMTLHLSQAIMLSPAAKRNPHTSGTFLANTLAQCEACSNGIEDHVKLASYMLGCSTCRGGIWPECPLQQASWTSQPHHFAC